MNYDWWKDGWDELQRRGFICNCVPQEHLKHVLELLRWHRFEAVQDNNWSLDSVLLQASEIIVALLLEEERLENLLKHSPGMVQTPDCERSK